MSTSVDSLTPEMRSFLQSLNQGILLRIPRRGGAALNVLISSVACGKTTENRYEVVYFTRELLLNAVQNLDPDIVLECLSKAEVVATYLNREIEVVDAKDGSRVDSYFSGL
jgi:hypothetical protein